MKHANAVTQQQQHAPHHYSPEAIGAMTVVGIVGIFGSVVALLLFIKLVRWTFGSKPEDHLRCCGGRHFQDPGER